MSLEWDGKENNQSDDKDGFVPHFGKKTANANERGQKTYQTKGRVKKTIIPPLPAQPTNGNAKPRKLNNNKVRISDLPDFAPAKWTKTFLPTLYDKFFMSSKPFSNFNLGSKEFLVLIQKTVERVYPEVECQVTASDAIYLLVSRGHILFIICRH